MIIRLIFCAGVMGWGCAVGAQNLNSAYFLDGYAYGHEMNPAKDYDRNAYFSFPFFGNVNLVTRGNLALGDFLVGGPTGGLVTALHPSIASSDFLGKLHENNILLGDLRCDVVGVGFHSGKAYHTITIGMRTNVGFNIPYELFEVAKQIENRNYSFTGLGATATAWMEAGYGYSRDINQAIRVGGKLKFLVGIGFARLWMDNVTLRQSDQNEWIATVNAGAEVGMKSFSWGAMEVMESETSGKMYRQIKLGNIDAKNPGVNGYGAAIDLGAEWDLEKQGWVDGLKVGIALLDFGFIRWRDVAQAQSHGEPFIFHFHQPEITTSGDSPLSQRVDEAVDRLSNLINLQDCGTGNKARMLGATLNISAEYRMPFYRPLKAGVLCTTYIQGKYTWNEERLALTVSPLKWLEMSGSMSIGTNGVGLGWVLNVHPRGFNLFTGMDYSIYKMSKQHIPLRSNSSFCIGINFPLGKSRVDYNRK